MNGADGLCRQCGWSVPYLVRPRQAPKDTISFTERYRGTVYDSRVSLEVAPGGGIARGRSFVVLGAMTVAAIFALIVLARPPV